MKKMKALLIILPLIILMLAPAISTAGTDSDGTFTEYAVIFDFDKDEIDGEASYSDTVDNLELTVFPVYADVINAVSEDGIEFDRRAMPLITATVDEGELIRDMTAYKFKFNRRVKLHSYTIGTSTGIWNEETVPPDIYGNKTPGAFGISSYYGFSADGPDMYDYGPGSEHGMASVDHDVSDIGLYGEDFFIYENGKGVGNFTIKSIKVIVSE